MPAMIEWPFNVQQTRRILALFEQRLEYLDEHPIEVSPRTPGGWSSKRLERAYVRAAAQDEEIEALDAFYDAAMKAAQENDKNDAPF